jgi:hypothetical protein
MNNPIAYLLYNCIGFRNNESLSLMAKGSHQRAFIARN